MPAPRLPNTSSLDDSAFLLLKEGRSEEALKMALSAVSEARHRAEDDRAEAAHLLSALDMLGTVQKELGHVDEAKAALEEALEVGATSGAPLLQMAGLRTSLATLLDFSQREAAAVPLYEQAITDYEGAESAEPEMGAQLRNNLAMIYKGLGKFALAEQHYLRALETLEKLHGARSESVAAVYNNLGGLYYTAGFAEQAREMFVEGLKSRLDLLGPNHPDVAQSYSNLATVCHELGDDAAAVENFESALRILEANIKDEVTSFELVGMDYLSLLDLMGEERKGAAFRKRMEKLLV